MRCTHASSVLQVPTFNTTLKGRVLLDLFSEPDIFNIKWDQLQPYNGIIYPALPDLYGPTMNVSCHLPLTCHACLVCPNSAQPLSDPVSVYSSGAQVYNSRSKTCVSVSLVNVLQQAYHEAYHQSSS